MIEHRYSNGLSEIRVIVPWSEGGNIIPPPSLMYWDVTTGEHVAMRFMLQPSEMTRVEGT